MFFLMETLERVLWSNILTAVLFICTAGNISIILEGVLGAPLKFLPPQDKHYREGSLILGRIYQNFQSKRTERKCQTFIMTSFLFVSLRTLKESVIFCLPLVYTENCKWPKKYNFSLLLISHSESQMTPISLKKC